MAHTSSFGSRAFAVGVRCSFLTFVAAACCLLATASAFSQEFKEATVDDSLAAQKATIIGSGDSAQIKDFLRKYYLARWTVRANARDLVKYRQELEQDVLSLSGDAQKTFIAETLSALNSYASSDACYPACRFNVALAMGTIDEAASADRNGAATPCADAIAPLATLVNSDKKPYPDYVRLAGLIGLVRHAELGIKDDKMRGNVKSLFVKILDPQFAAQKGLRDDVYEWFQEKAVQGLAAFKTPDGANGGTGTLDLFKQLINDDKQKFEVRCLAARAIGEMDLTAASGYDFLDLSKSLILLARGFCTENMSYIDTEIVRDSVKSSAASGVSTGSGAMGGGMGMGSGMGMGGGMSGGAMGGGMAGSGNIQNVKSLEAIAARILYGFDSIERAVKGVKNGGQGVLAQLDDSKDAEKEMKANLDTMIQEFAEMAEFVKNGSQSAGGMYGGMTGGGMGMGATSAAVGADANSLKNHLLEKRIKFDELLGIDSY